jgi:preprotein translocase subunit SecY
MILSFLLLLSLRLISIIVQARNLSWKTKEISEDLRNKGVYIDGIAPGRETKKTLDNVINKMSLL